MEKSVAFERAFVALLAERVESSGMSHSEFGRRVFGEDSGSRTWRSTRDPERARKITLAEVHLAANVLGLDFPTMVWQFTQEIRAKEGV